MIQFKAVKIKLSSCFAIAFHSTLCYIRLFLLISVPPSPILLVEDLPFFLAFEEFLKIAFTPEDFHKIWVYPRRIWVYPWRISWKGEFSLFTPWRFCWILKLYPQRISYFFYLTPKEILNFLTYPRRILPVLNQWRGVGCWYYNAIAHW